MLKRFQVIGGRGCTVGAGCGHPQLPSFTTTKRTAVTKLCGLGPSGSLPKHQLFNCDIIKLL